MVNHHVSPSACSPLMEGLSFLILLPIVRPSLSPSTQDLGKSSNDLLGKDYHFQGASLEVKTNTPSGVAFKSAGSRDAKTQAINGEIEAKWSDRKHGLTVTQAWTTANVLRSQVELENQIAKGLKLDLTTSLYPEKGAKAALINAIYKQSGFHTRANLDLFKVGVCLSEAAHQLLTNSLTGSYLHC